MTRLDRTNAPHHVYRCFDREGRLVYVGSSATLYSRLEQHRTGAWWAPTVVRVTAAYYPDGITARDAERRAIREEVPRWNKSGKWAGRDLWTRDDWHDWLHVLVRDGLSNQLETSVRDYQSLFGEAIPANLSDLIERQRAAAGERKAKWDAELVERAKLQAIRETAELRELNEELTRLMDRQEALARALGIEWDDPELCYPEAAIDAALAAKQREARGETLA